jgi:hypothetical protein
VSLNREPYGAPHALRGKAMPDTRVSPTFRRSTPCRPGDPPHASRPSARKAPRRDRVAPRPRCGGLTTKEKHHEQQAKPYRLRRHRPERGQRPQSQWIEVGAVWPHKSGKGFDLVIPDGISLSGRIVCRERKEQPAE